MKISRIAIASLALVASQAWAVEPAVISFQAPTKYTDGTPIAAGTPISYSVLQGVKGAAKAKVATISGTSTTITTGLVPGVEYCFAVLATIDSVDSSVSNESCKLTPKLVPEPVVITVR